MKHQPQQVYFTGRNSEQADTLLKEAQALAPDTNLSFIPCDFSSLDSVAQAASKVQSEISTLDVLMCNAGVMAIPAGLTKDGYENQFGINHVAHALLIKLLLPVLLRTAEAGGTAPRIISLTSTGFRHTPLGGIVFAKVKTPQDDLGMAGTWGRYGQSKLANILYAAELARRYPSITTVSVHPGVVKTTLVSKLGAVNKGLVYLLNWRSMKSPAEGAYNQLWAATAENVSSGVYYEPIGVRGKPSKDSDNAKLAGELYEWTDKELAGY